MSNNNNRFSRRKFLQTSALTAAAAASGTLAAPSILRAQSGTVKVGFLQPVSGALAYSGQQGRLGASIAPEASLRSESAIRLENPSRGRQHRETVAPAKAGAQM